MFGVDEMIDYNACSVCDGLFSDEKFCEDLKICIHCARKANDIALRNTHGMHSWYRVREEEIILAIQILKDRFRLTK